MASTLDHAAFFVPPFTGRCAWAGSHHPYDAASPSTTLNLTSSSVQLREMFDVQIAQIDLFIKKQIKNLTWSRQDVKIVCKTIPQSYFHF